jgi:AraC family transcriptional activator of tynA and feaB
MTASSKVRINSEYEAWRAQVGTFCIGQRDETVDCTAFVGSMRTMSVWGLEAADLSANIHMRVERTHRHVRIDGLDYYKAVFQVTGRSTILQNDQIIELASGDVALVDSGRPLTYISSGLRRLIGLTLPRQLLISHLGLEPQGSLVRHSDTHASRALFQLILDSVDKIDPSFAPAEPYMQLAIYNLFGALFSFSDLPSISSAADKLFRRVCNIIKNHFSDPDVGPPEVAAEAGISLRYLQKLFAEHGTTCTSFMQSVRLDHAARLLSGRALARTSQPISEIAYACGFRNYGHFSRTFRQRFGHSPGANSQSSRRPLPVGSAL